MDEVVGLIDAMAELGDLVAESAPRHRRTTEAKAAILIGDFLGTAEVDMDRVHKARWRMRQLRERASVAATSSDPGRC